MFTYSAAEKGVECLKRRESQQAVVQVFGVGNCTSALNDLTDAVDDVFVVVREAPGRVH